MGQWVYVPDRSTVFVTPSPIYPAVGGDDDITVELDHFTETHTGAIVIDLLDNDQA